eukprot:g2206.t1
MMKATQCTCVMMAVLICVVIYGTVNMNEEAMQAEEVTVMQMEKVEASRNVEGVKQRASCLWLAAEVDGVVKVLLKRGTDNMVGCFQGQSRPAEIPRRAALRALRESFGLEEENVEFLSPVSHGPFAHFADFTTYVAYALPKNADTATRAAGSSAEWIAVLDITQVLMKEEGHPSKRYEAYIHDDLGAVHAFLQPFIRTAGRDPVQCLGPPPGWRRSQLPAEFPWLRLHGKN